VIVFMTSLSGDGTTWTSCCLREAGCELLDSAHNVQSLELNASCTPARRALGCTGLPIHALIACRSIVLAARGIRYMQETQTNTPLRGLTQQHGPSADRVRALRRSPASTKRYLPWVGGQTQGGQALACQYNSNLARHPSAWYYMTESELDRLLRYRKQKWYHVGQLVSRVKGVVPATPCRRCQGWSVECIASNTSCTPLQNVEGCPGIGMLAPTACPCHRSAVLASK